MGSLLIILPFLSLFSVALTSAFASSFVGLSWIKPVGYTCSLMLLVLWVYLDFENLKTRFKKKSLKHGLSSGFGIVLVLVALTLTAVMSNRARFNKQIDVTRLNSNTLSNETLSALKKINNDESILVEGYFQDQVLLDQFSTLVGLYSNAGVDFELEYIDPQTNPDRVIASNISSTNMVVLKFQGREERLTSFNEEKMTNALVGISKGSSKKVYFLEGHGESMIRGSTGLDFGMAVTLLENQKVAVDSLSLLKAGKIPKDADALIIAGIKYDFKEPELEIIQSYLNQGGSLFAAIDAVTSVPKLNSFFESYGLSLQNDLLILPPEDIRSQMFGQNITIIDQFDEMSAVTKDLAGGVAGKSTELLIPFVRTVEKVDASDLQLNTRIVANTADTMLRVMDIEVKEDLNDVTEDQTEMGSFGVLGVSFGKISGQNEDNSGKRSDSRVVILGSSYFMNNQGMQLSVANSDLLAGIVGFLTRDQNFVSVPSKKVISGSIKLVSETSQMILIFLSYLFPFVALSFGILIWVRRKAL